MLSGFFVRLKGLMTPFFLMGFAYDARRKGHKKYLLQYTAAFFHKTIVHLWSMQLFPLPANNYMVIMDSSSYGASSLCLKDIAPFPLRLLVEDLETFTSTWGIKKSFCPPPLFFPSITLNSNFTFSNSNCRHELQYASRFFGNQSF
jgi:hypothetical protein